MKVNRKLLLSRLESVSAGLAKSQEIEQSDCFVFAGGELITFNDEVACRVPSPLGDFQGAVPAAKLLALLRKLTEEEVNVEMSESEIRIKGKRRKAGFAMEDETRLPVGGIDPPGKWKKLPDNFAAAVKEASRCVSKDTQKFILTCVHITSKYLESCDNYQTLRYPIDTPIKSDCLVRGESLHAIAAVGVIEVSQTGNWIHFRNSDGLVLCCRQYVKQYPAVGDLLAVEGEAIKLPKGLKEVVDKAAIFSADVVESDMIDVELREGCVKVDGRGQGGWYSELAKIKYAGKSIRFRVDPKLFSDAIGLSRACTVSGDRLKIENDRFSYVLCMVASSDEDTEAGE